MKSPAKLIAPPARKGKENRIALSARIDSSTKKQIIAWKGESLSEGVIVDKVVNHAARTKFNPAKDVL